MADRIEVHHLIILDRSGSMCNITESTISGFNEVVEQIEEDAKKFEDEQEHLVSLVVFNGNVETAIWMESANSIDPLTTSTYIPTGGTALYDAITGSLNQMKTELATKLKNDEAKVNVVVITDGHNTASKEFTQADAKKQVDELNEGDDSPWLFQFIGANIDTDKEAKSLGFDVSMSYMPNDIGTQQAFSKLSETRGAYSESISRGMSKSAIVTEAEKLLKDEED